MSVEIRPFSLISVLVRSLQLVKSSNQFAGQTASADSASRNSKRLTSTTPGVLSRSVRFGNAQPFVILYQWSPYATPSPCRLPVRIVATLLISSRRRVRSNERLDICASRADVCTFSGTQEVRYGANGSYFYRTLRTAPPVPTAFLATLSRVHKELLGQGIAWTSARRKVESAPSAVRSKCATVQTVRTFYRTLSNGTNCTTAYLAIPSSARRNSAISPAVVAAPAAATGRSARGKMRRARSPAPERCATG